jgi:hypothetical protein
MTQDERLDKDQRYLGNGLHNCKFSSVKIKDLLKQLDEEGKDSINVELGVTSRVGFYLNHKFSKEELLNMDKDTLVEDVWDEDELDRHILDYDHITEFEVEDTYTE